MSETQMIVDDKPKMRSGKAKRAVSEMKAADSSKGTANGNPNKSLAFRYMSLLKALRAISDAQGLRCAGKQGDVQIHWSKDAVVLIGTALEKRLREILASALSIVSFGKKQTVTERALLFAASTNKDCVSVFMVPEKVRSRPNDAIQTAIDHVISPAAVHRISVQVGIQRMSQSKVVQAFRQASRFFLYNLVSDIKDILSLKPKSTVSSKLAAVVIGNWASLAGFKANRKTKATPAPAPIPAEVSDPVVEVKAEPVEVVPAPSEPVVVEEVPVA
jgi:histone H3/H4